MRILEEKTKEISLFIEFGYIFLKLKTNFIIRVMIYMGNNYSKMIKKEQYESFSGTIALSEIANILSNEGHNISYNM